jgi:sphingolipid C9-methyltransferase
MQTVRNGLRISDRPRLRPERYAAHEIVSLNGSTSHPARRRDNPPAMSKLTDYVVFHDQKLAAKFANGRMPIDTLWEAYFDGALDIPGDIYKLLEDRHVVAKHPFTKEHVKYFVTKFVPETIVHSKAYDTKLVRDTYDRGDDFYGMFLGPRMVYTSGYFNSPNESVEQAQDHKLDMVCQKLDLRAGEKFLDIGCGWGTLTMHAAKHYGVDATGVTLSKNQAEFANERIKANGLEGKARVICSDYRDIAKGQFNKISNLEMVEHVGVKNLKPFYEQVYELLADDGLFLMQWTGLRRNSKMEDLVWGLFMAKYIFPGADASLPLAPMMNVMEKANWEIHSVENISYHYKITIKMWHDNWLSNKDNVIAAYGERWFRIWHVFLAWATTIAAQGTAACFQVLSHKNLNTFDRSRFIGNAKVATRMKLDAQRPDWKNNPVNERAFPRPVASAE